MSEYQYDDEVLIGLGEVISFHPELCRVFGGIHEALLFQQLYYWRRLGKREDGFIYKTKAEIEKETCINRYQLDKARVNLERLGVLETRLLRANGSPTLHYRVSVRRANEVLAVARRTDGKADIDYSEKLISTNGKAETSDSITETTTKTTQRDIDSPKVESTSGPKSSPSTPDPKDSKQPREPHPNHQLIEYVRTIQGHAPYVNTGMHYRNAKAILATYTLDEAKQTADLMLRDEFWKTKGFTAKNLADRIHQFIAEVRDNPETSDNQACLATVRYMARIPLDHVNDIGKATNSHWMALDKVGKDISRWVIEHRRTKLNRKEWLLAELKPQADALRKQYGDFVYMLPTPAELLASPPIRDATDEEAR